MRATSQGGTAQGSTLQVTVDAVAPTGSVAINANAPFTKTRAVTLSLAATDPSGVAEMCLSNEASCPVWEPFAKTKAWNLAPGDGVKTVSAWFRDRVGNGTVGAVQDQIALDSKAPSNPTTLATSSHQVGVWSNDRTVAVNWTGASDDGSGVAGYSIKWDRIASTLPDAIRDTTSRTAISSSLANGSNHFVHIRTVDQAGNGADGAVHLGPLLIDGTPPVNGKLVSTPGPATISLRWTGFSDATSGLATADTYRLVFRTSAYPATRCTTGVPLLVGTATQFEHRNLTRGVRYYYRICAVDKAGNVSTGAARAVIAE
jgi:hypothetical protein